MCVCVIALLWKIVTRWQLCKIIKEEIIKKEIETLRSRHGTTASAIYLDAISHPPSFTLSTLQSNIMSTSTKNAASTIAMSGMNDKGEDVDNSIKHLSLIYSLFKWCQAVVANYGLRLHDWTHSFSDGKALCYMLHHYHPTLLRREEILPTTNDLLILGGGTTASTPRNNNTLATMEPYMSRYYDASVTDAHVSTAMDNEMRNYKLVNSRVSSLGCVPMMLTPCNSVRLPEEKSMITFVTFLCARVLESSKEIRATLAIQKIWRRHYAHQVRASINILIIVFHL